MPRNLVPETVKKFRGINVWSSFANSTPDQATDCLNVIPSGSGAVEKMRVPVPLTSVAIPETLVRLRQYENGLTGLRQVVGQFGSKLYTFDQGWNATLIDTNALNAQALFDFIESNNRFFGANGFRNFKWDGATLTQWGIAQPAAAPNIATHPAPGATPVNIAAAGAATAIGALSRTGNDVACVFGVQVNTLGYQLGDVVQLTGNTPADFNGFFQIDNIIGNTIHFAQVGPNEVASGLGTCQDGNLSGVYRWDNEVTVLTATAHGRMAGDFVTIAAVTDASFDGTFQIDAILSPTQFSFAQVGAAAISGGGTSTPASSAIYTLGGRSYRISYANSKTGHIGNASDISPATGNLNGTLNVTVSGPASTDPQVNSAILWSTVDGGSDFYFNQQITIVPLAAPVFQDTTADIGLDTSRVAPLINNPPPLGKFLAKWQGRSLIFDLQNDPQGLAYSGYEDILEGLPEESFPPNNLLHLQLGISELRGVGATGTGLVLFARSQRDKLDSMYLLQGQLQDITIDAPVQLSTFLRPLPWKLGCFSRYSVIETPHGVVWLASDKTLQIFDGMNAPKCLSDSINPLLRQITPGTEANIRAAYFNYLERDWVVLLCALNGSQSNNQILILDLDPNPAKNVGLFRSDIQADEIAVVEDGANQSLLVTVSQGILSQFLALSDTTLGISEAPTSTSGVLRAYWDSGVFGNTDPEIMKIFRWARAVRDPQSTDFYVQPRVIGEDDNFAFPTLGKLERLADDGRFAVNKKGRRVILHVQFPDVDESANLIELTQTYIPLAQR